MILKPPHIFSDYFCHTPSHKNWFSIISSKRNLYNLRNHSLVHKIWLLLDKCRFLMNHSLKNSKLSNQWCLKKLISVLQSFWNSSKLCKLILVSELNLDSGGFWTMINHQEIRNLQFSELLHNVIILCGYVHATVTVLHL